MSILIIRKIILSLVGFSLVVTAATTASAQQTHPATKNGSFTRGIFFTNNEWKEVAAEAKKNGKYIFVDAYASWCGPCKLLKSTTFKEKNAATYFNKNFINYTIDMEKGEGVELADIWDITAYPALLFFSPDGKIVLKQIGYVDGRKLIEFGQQALAKQ